jgi:hypothetical protein
MVHSTHFKNTTLPGSAWRRLKEAKEPHYYWGSQKMEHNVETKQEEILTGNLKRPRTKESICTEKVIHPERSRNYVTPGPRRRPWHF